MTQISRWNVTGASVVGTSHIREGLECQDRFVWKLFDKDQILVAVISDGAGSTRFGGEGAELACSTFVEQIENYVSSAESSDFNSLNEDFGRLWVEHFQHLAIGRAVAEEVDIREFSCTFSAAVITPEKAKFFQIGDGRILFTRNGEFDFGIQIPETEYVNMTSFLTDEDAADRIEYVETESELEDIVLFTDGIESIAIDFSTGKPHEPFLKPMLAPLRNGSDGASLSNKLIEFLSSPAINEKTDDDKTLILASRKDD